MSEGVPPHADGDAPVSASSGPADADRELVGTASERQLLSGAAVGKLVAFVRVAVEMTEDDKDALTRALERRFGHAIELDLEVDSRILGGVWVQVGDTIIDGSLQGRLEALRHHLRTSSRTLVLGSERTRASESGQQ